MLRDLGIKIFSILEFNRHNNISVINVTLSMLALKEYYRFLLDICLDLLMCMLPRKIIKKKTGAYN